MFPIKLFSNPLTLCIYEVCKWLESGGLAVGSTSYSYRRLDILFTWAVERLKVLIWAQLFLMYTQWNYLQIWPLKKHLLYWPTQSNTCKLIFGVIVGKSLRLLNFLSLRNTFKVIQNIFPVLLLWCPLRLWAINIYLTCFDVQGNIQLPQGDPDLSFSLLTPS